MDALPADLALRYLHELTASQLAGVVLGADGELLAGDERLSRAAQELLQALPQGTHEAAATGAQGGVFAARDCARTVIVVCGPGALAGLVLHDLRTVLGDLAAGPPPAPGEPARATLNGGGAPSSGVAAAAERLLSAVQSGSAG